MPAGANSPPLSPPKRSARSWALSVCVSTAYPLAIDLARTRLGKLVPNQYLLRNHVGRPVLYRVPADRIDCFVGITTGAILQRDHRNHVLADGRILHAEGAGLVYEPRAQEEILDLLGAQAVALVLDHGILTPQ